MSVLTGSALELYNTLKNKESFPKDLLTSSGTSPDALLSDSIFPDILALNLMVQLDSAFHGTESLLRNVVFGLNLGNDEIGFDLKIFRDKNTPSHMSSSGAVSS